MHLNDLFEDDIDFTVRPLKGAGNPNRMSSDQFVRYDQDTNEPEQNKSGLDKLGAGVLAFAVAKKDKPHDVKRITFRSGSYTKDPYLTFLRTAIKNQDNPHFPKIYMVKIFRRPGKQDFPYLYYVETERLSSWDKLNWAQLSYLYRQYLGSSIRDYAKKNDRMFVDKMDVMNEFMRHLQSTLTGEYRSGTEYDETELNSTLSDLRKVLKMVDPSGVTVYNDLHRGNVMYRITPYGVTPVITDPFHGHPMS